MPAATSSTAGRGITRRFQSSNGLNQAEALRQLALTADFAARQEPITLMQQVIQYIGDMGINKRHHARVNPNTQHIQGSHCLPSFSRVAGGCYQEVPELDRPRHVRAGLYRRLPSGTQHHRLALGDLGHGAIQRQSSCDWVKQVARYRLREHVRAGLEDREPETSTRYRRSQWMERLSHTSQHLSQLQLDEDVYMRQALGFEKADSQERPLIMKLCKSISGLRQSPRCGTARLMRI